MKFQIDIEQEIDGRCLAEVDALQALALRVLAEKLEHGEAVPELLDVSFQAA